MLAVLAHHPTYDLEKCRKITKDVYKCIHKIKPCMLHAINLSKNSIISPSVYSFMRWNARCARLEMHEAYKLLQKGILYYGLRFPQIFERTKNSFEEQTLRTIDILWNTDIQPYQEKNYDWQRGWNLWRKKIYYSLWKWNTSETPQEWKKTSPMQDTLFTEKNKAKLDGSTMKKTTTLENHLI